MGLTIPRNPLAFPGRAPGVNHNHLAVKGGNLRCSVVAGPGVGVTNLLNPVPLATLIGGSGHVASVSSFGPVVDFPQGTTAGIFVPGVKEAPTSFIWASIFSVDSAHTPTTNPVLFASNATNPNSVASDCLFYTGSSLEPSILAGLTAGSWAVALPVNTPVLLVISYKNVPGVGSYGVNMMLNMATGEILSVFDTGSAAVPTPNTTGQYLIGNAWTPGTPDSEYVSCAKIAAMAYITNNFLTLGDALEWAKAPWDLWYPPTALQTMFSALSAPVPHYGTATGAASVLGVTGTSGGATGQASALGVIPVFGTANGQASALGSFGITRSATGTANGQATVVGESNPASAFGTANGQSTAIGSVLYSGALAQNIFLPNPAAAPTYVYPRVISQNLTVHLTDAEAYRWGRTITQALTLHLTQAEKATYHVTDTEVTKLAAAFTRAFPVVLSQNLTAHQAATMAFGVVLLQRLNLIPVHTPENHYHLAIAQAILMNSALQRFIGLSLTQNMTAHAAQSLQYVASPVLSQALTVHQALLNTLMFSFTDTINVHPQHIPRMIYNGDPLIDTINLTGLYVSPNGTVTTWAVNTRTNAITEYTNFAFNSFAQAGLKYIATSKAGIYELDGDTDAGQSIIAEMQTGLMQLNATKLAGLKGVYLAVRGGGRFYIKLISGDGREYIYEAFAQPGLMTTKVNVGKGLRTSYIAFNLKSEGQDFDLSTLEFVPMLSDRRV
jgi:hypothetical protein